MKKSILSLLVGFSVASQAFADDLHQVYQRALEQDPTINRAQADRDAAFEGISISRASLLPQVSGVISYTDSSQDQFNTDTNENPNEPDNPKTIFSVINNESTN